VFRGFLAKHTGNLAGGYLRYRSSFISPGCRIGSLKKQIQKEEGVVMTDKRNALLLSLLEQGIHYIEEGDAKLFLVVTRSEERDTFDFFLRTAKTEDEAKIESVKSGEIVMIHRFADIFARMVDPKTMQGGKQDLLM
jgi:hypothetical protein